VSCAGEEENEPPGAMSGAPGGEEAAEGERRGSPWRKQRPGTRARFQIASAREGIVSGARSAIDASTAAAHPFLSPCRDSARLPRGNVLIFNFPVREVPMGAHSAIARA
jgi:hypothetical protein